MMTVFLHEMRQNFKTLAIWSVVIGGMVVMCMVLFPDMKEQSEDISAMFANMGAFTEAFGMDRLSLGDPLGFLALRVVPCWASVAHFMQRISVCV